MRYSISAIRSKIVSPLLEVATINILIFVFCIGAISSQEKRNVGVFSSLPSYFRIGCNYYKGQNCAGILCKKFSWGVGPTTLVLGY